MSISKEARRGPARLHRAVAAALLPLLLLVVAAPAASAQAAGCTLTLYLNASASTLFMDGSAVVQPIQQPLELTYPDAAIGLNGVVDLVLPSGPCPTTAAGLEQQLAGATLQTNTSTGPLSLYPAESIQVGLPSSWGLRQRSNPTATCCCGSAAPVHPLSILLAMDSIVRYCDSLVAVCLQLKGATFVTLDLQANRFSVSSQPLAAAAGGGATAGAYTTPELRGVIVEGTVLSTSLISTEVLSMVGENAANTSTVTASVQASPPLAALVEPRSCPWHTRVARRAVACLISLPLWLAVSPVTRLSVSVCHVQGSTLSLSISVDWAVRSTYNTTFGTNTIQGISEYVFRGQIVADTTLGCTVDCGPNGRCAEADDGAVGCTCKCAWAGTNCTTPSGFCSAFPTELSSSAVCPALPPPSPAPGPDSPCRPVEGEAACLREKEAWRH